MGYKVTYKPHWIHITYTGYVDAYDVITQVNDDNFWERLSKIKLVLFDYSQADEVAISQEDLKDFATIARVQADLIGPIDVVTVIRGPDRMENAKAYKAAAQSPNWRVHITTSLEEAETLLNNELIR